jgi:predicted ATPase
MVELAPLADPALVAQAIAAALGLRPPAGRSHESILLESLREHRQLLVLDNCEHLIDACARLTEALLKTCPRIRVLATSREALGVPGEVSWRVPSLAPSEAALLFEDRAGLARPGFHLDANSLPTVESICQRLDGIPLAIELAAARVRMMPPEEIVGRLQDRFRLLTGGSRTALERHQTLRAAVDWSYALLDATEQALFRVLSVFSGSFDLEAAAAVMGESDRYAVMDGLTTLVDKSLLVSEEESARYRMLETLRQYGHERLLESGGAAELRGRQLSFYLDRAEQAGRKQPQALLRDLDNFRSALEWSIESDPEKGLRLITTLAWLFTNSGIAAEGRTRLERLLPKVVEPGRVRAWGLFEAGWFAWWQGDLEVGFNYFQESGALARQIQDRALLAKALHGAGTVAGEIDRAAAVSARARDLLGQALAVFREDGDIQGQATCLQALGIGAVMSGNLEQAREELTACLEIRRSDSNNVEVAIPLGFLSFVSLRTGALDEAETYVVEALSVNRRTGNRVGLGLNLAAVIMLAGLRGQLELAVLCGAAADAEQKATGMERFRNQLGPEQWYALARDSLGESRVAELVARGQRMSLDQALDLASDQVLRPSSR